MSWIDKLIESYTQGVPGTGLFPDEPEFAWVIFRRSGGVFELLEQQGYGELDVRYEFLESPDSWARALDEGGTRVSQVPGYFQERELWVILDKKEDPEYMLVAELPPVPDSDPVALLRMILNQYVNRELAFDQAELPVWLNRILPGLDKIPSPLLIVSERGSGREELSLALLQRRFRGSAQGLYFQPGRLSEAVQLREIFGDSAGNRLGGTGAGVPLLRRPEPAIVIQEAGELAPQVQLRLLALFASGEARKKFWIFETTRNLAAMVEAGLFEEGLYNILKTNEQLLPPVRASREELVFETHRLIEELRKSYGRDVGISTDALDVLADYSWPGNWKELKATLEAAFLMCPGSEIGAGDIRPGNWTPLEDSDLLNLRRRSEEMEKSLLLKAYALHGGNQVHMARALGISRGSLQYKMEKYKLS